MLPSLAVIEAHDPVLPIAARTARRPSPAHLLLLRPHYPAPDGVPAGLFRETPRWIPSTVGRDAHTGRTCTVLGLALADMRRDRLSRASRRSHPTRRCCTSKPRRPRSWWSPSPRAAEAAPHGRYLGLPNLKLRPGKSLAPCPFISIRAVRSVFASRPIGPSRRPPPEITLSGARPCLLSLDTHSSIAAHSCWPATSPSGGLRLFSRTDALPPRR